MRGRGGGGGRSVPRAHGLVVAVTLLVAAAGCARPLPPLPLRPEPIPWADTLPIAEPGVQGEGRIVRALTVQLPYSLAEPFRVGAGEGEALNRTHFDDVVSSAWWERRMGYRALTPAELASGPLSPDGAPDTDRVLTVRSAKVDGTTPGFVMEDAKGDVYVVKLDPVGVPYLQSAAGAIANRLAWGAGYWVPEDYVATLDSADLRVAMGARAEEDGVDRAMTPEDVQRVLARAAPLPDGRFRFLASRFVPGAPKGPFLFSGVREDDPNDHFRHEHRRELRALRVISAWVNDTDRREGNTLDVYLDPPGYLRHYLIDFGAALGSGTDRPKHPRDDVERTVDPWAILGRLVTLGFYQAGWEDEPHPVVHPALGFVRAESFDPDGWKATWDNPAFFAMTEADAYWAAKIVSAFSEAHIRAAVGQGRLPEPWLADTLTQVLVHRRDALVRRYFSGVTPIEEPRVAEARGSGSGSGSGSGFVLAFRDLGLERGLWTAARTRYAWTLSHPARGIESAGDGEARAGPPGEPAHQMLEVAWSEDAPAGGSAAAEGARRSGGGDLRGEEALAVLRVLAVRDPSPLAPSTPRAATVWLRWNGAGARYEVVGLEH